MEAIPQEHMESLCSYHSKSNTTTNQSIITPLERSKTSNDTGCETDDYKNSTQEHLHNTSGSTINSKNSNLSQSSGRNLIVNYLPQNMNEMDIHKLFSLYGDVESCKLIRNRDLKQSLGYAFVKYYTVESANKATSELNGLIVENKRIKVSIARPSRPEIKDANLYVGGLPANCSEIQLKQLFSEYGEIISCRVIKPSQKSADYHFGFVRFDTNSQAQLAMQSVHGKIPPSNIFPDAIGPVTVKFARTPNPPESLFHLQYPYSQYSNVPDHLHCQANVLSTDLPEHLQRHSNVLSQLSTNVPISSVIFLF